MTQEVLFSKNKEATLLAHTNHGLIVGGKRSGKSTTLQILAESYSNLGIPVLTCDTTGRLSGLASKFVNDKEILSETKVAFWDPFSKKGIPLNTSISEMGPLLLARILDLTPTQEGVLTICFALADDNHMLMNDFDDLRKVLKHLRDNLKEYELNYGYASTKSISAIQRKLLSYEREGLSSPFTLPSIDVFDFLAIDNNLGVINILSLDQVGNYSLIYSTLILFILASIYDEFPLSSSLKFVVLIDDADNLFNNLDRVLAEKLKVIIKRLRDKGVAIYFATNNLTEIPNYIKQLLLNKIYLPMPNKTKQQKDLLKQLCLEIPTDNEMDLERTLIKMKIGQALVSFLDQENSVMEAKLINFYTPKTKMGSADRAIINSVIKESALYQKYSIKVDTELIIPTLDKKTQNGKKDKGNIMGGKIIKTTLETAAKTFGRQIGNSLARNLLLMLENKIESFDG